MSRSDQSASTSFWRIGLLLVLGLVGVGGVLVAKDWNQHFFKLTGYVVHDGTKFYLHPNDSFLTPSVVILGEYEPEETNLIQSILKPGDTFIDVGANIGWYSVKAGRWVGPNGKVVAFEPDPTNAAMLRKNLTANGLTNVLVEEKGLADQAGSFTLNLSPENLGRHSMVLNYSYQQTIEVQTIRFDDYWKGEGEIKLIKIDTEGAEGMILAGMRETIQQQKNLQLILEFAPHRLEQSGYAPDKLLQELYSYGYQVSKIDEELRQVVKLGQPNLAELGLEQSDDDTYLNLHFQR